MKLSRHIYILWVSSILLLFGTAAHAQQVIINVPSSEVIPKGKVILKGSNRFSPFHPNGYVSMTPSATVGIGHNVELAGGVSTSIASETRVRGDFSAKKVFFIKNHSRFTLGTRINPYLMEVKAPYNFTYAHFSTRFKKTKTTLTAGTFVASSDNVLPDQPGAVLGIEQVILSNKLRFVADWISRNESYGLLAAGLKYRPTPTTSLTSAVLIPNGNNGDLAFSISFSKILDNND